MCMLVWMRVRMLYVVDVCVTVRGTGYVDVDGDEYVDVNVNADVHVDMCVDGDVCVCGCACEYACVC